jgi:hypothetical protein
LTAAQSAAYGTAREKELIAAVDEPQLTATMLGNVKVSAPAGEPGTGAGAGSQGAAKGKDSGKAKHT